MEGLTALLLFLLLYIVLWLDEQPDCAQCESNPQSAGVDEDL